LLEASGVAVLDHAQALMQCAYKQLKHKTGNGQTWILQLQIFTSMSLCIFDSQSCSQQEMT
jgi:hypothetical protein